MTRILLMVALVAVAVPAAAQQQLADQLRKGIAEEETGKSLDKAIQAYQAIVARYDEDRKVAGTALLRLADCYRKTNKREQAVTTYQRVVREFGDQAAIVESSRQQLAALGAPEGRGRGGVFIADRPREIAPERREQPFEVSPERLREPVDLNTTSLADTKIALDDVRMKLSRAKDLYERGLLGGSDLEALQTQMKRLEERLRQQQEQLILNRELMAGVQKEIALIQTQIAGYEGKIKVGTAAPDDAQLLQLRRDLIALQQRLAELRAKVR